MATKASRLKVRQPNHETAISSLTTGPMMRRRLHRRRLFGRFKRVVRSFGGSFDSLHFESRLCEQAIQAQSPGWLTGLQSSRRLVTSSR